VYCPDGYVVLFFYDSFSKYSSRTVFFFKVKMSFFLLLISQIKTTLVESSLRPGFLDHPKQSFTV
jgi:hypothetical protein